MYPNALPDNQKYSMKLYLKIFAALLMILSLSWAAGVNYPAFFDFKEEPCEFSDYPELSFEGDTVSYCGLISPSGVIEFLNFDLPRVNHLQLRSSGGDGRLALILADYIFNHDISVNASGLCASACVSVWLRSPKASIGEEGLLLVHSETRARLSMIGADKRLENLNLLDPFSSLDARVIWSEATASVEPICAGRIDESGSLSLYNEDGENAFRSSYDYSIPDKETLERWRGALETHIDPEYPDSNVLRRAALLIGPQKVLIQRTDAEMIALGAGFIEALNRGSFDTCS